MARIKVVGSKELTPRTLLPEDYVASKKFAWSFGKELKRLREEVNKTQDELATRAGVSRSYIAHLEQGIKDNADLQKIYRVLDALVSFGALEW